MSRCLRTAFLGLGLLAFLGGAANALPYHRHHHHRYAHHVRYAPYGYGSSYGGGLMNSYTGREGGG